MKHAHFEMLAGAIALNEATDAQRHEYRAHLAACVDCREHVGGEHEIERTMAQLHAARESEVWSPDASDALRRSEDRRRARLRFATVLGLAAACAAVTAVSFMPHASVSHPVLARVQRAHADANRLASAATRIVTVTPRLVVQHNVVQIARAPVPLPQAQAEPRAQQTVTIAVHPARAHRAHVVQAGVPVWRRGDPMWRTVAKTTLTSTFETAAQPFTGRAESLQIEQPPVVREAEPIGGETAIDPQPPMIAYDEGAQGIAVFQVSIDERGTPSKCIITKSTGYHILDESVCKAALRARFAPKTVGGRAVPGTYQDAFTFRMSEDAQSVLASPANP